MQEKVGSIEYAEPLVNFERSVEGLILDSRMDSSVSCSSSGSRSYYLVVIVGRRVKWSAHHRSIGWLLKNHSAQQIENI